MISANVVHEWVPKLPWHHVETLAKLAEERHFEPGEVLFHQGDLADRLYVIVSGTVGITLPCGKNSFIAETVIASEEIGWDALIEEGVRRATAKALTEVQSLVFNGPELRAECERDLQLGYLLMKQLALTVWERLDASRLLLLIRA